MAEPVLELDRVSFRYRWAGQLVPVLAEVSLRLERGEFVSLVGPSGVGKSTIFRLVAGLLEPDSGAVRLAGAGASRLGRAAYMPQKDCLMPWRSVLDNAALFLELRGMPRYAARERVRPNLENFGLAGFEHALPHQLSGGMRQRAAFLRTVLGGQELLLLDEPFGALDALTRAEMQEWLLGLWQRLGKTVLFITHDVEEALLLSDRVYVLTGQPARLGPALPVPFPRPRDYGAVASPAFVNLRARLLRELKGVAV